MLGDERAGHPGSAKPGTGRRRAERKPGRCPTKEPRPAPRPVERARAQEKKNTGAPKGAGVGEKGGGIPLSPCPGGGNLDERKLYLCMTTVHH